MSSALDHFSHPNHPLTLNEDVSEVGAKCYVCDERVTSSPTYTCSSHESVACKSFYLHKSCAELPKRTDHPKHSQHRLTLLPRPHDYVCDICSRLLKFAYTCDDCKFDLCVFCVSNERLLHHESHRHQLTLMNRTAVVECDACGDEARDSSYVCTVCEFWVHKKCAFADSTVTSPHHHHALRLIYSFPYVYRSVLRDCNVCGKLVCNSNWMYFCQQCTYFVHMDCATSTESAADETDSEVDIEDEIDKLEERIDNLSTLGELVQSPLDSEESPIHGIASFVSDLF